MSTIFKFTDNSTENYQSTQIIWDTLHAYPNRTIKSVVIGSNVTTINDYVFTNQTTLEEVTFADNGDLWNIGMKAFENTNLTSVNIPSSITTIGEGAFKGAGSLTSITFQDATKITSFGSLVFNDISSNPTFTFQTATQLSDLHTDIQTQLNAITTKTLNFAPDTTAPTITLVGAATMTVEVGNYVEQGATVSDNVDGNSTINAPTTGSIDINTVGTYTLEYTRKDAAGNQGNTVTRTVHVVPVGHAPVCFLAGTPIQTNQGKVPIEKLNPKFHTIRGKTIQAITKTITPDDSLICFEPNSLGNQLPSQKTVISMNHKIFYQGKMTKAKYFVGNTGIYKIPYKQETLYNVLLETHDKMIVNNMICETLDPRNTIAQLYMSLKKIPEEKHASVFSQYNAFCKEHNIYGTDSNRPKSKGAAFRPKL